MPPPIRPDSLRAPITQAGTPVVLPPGVDQLPMSLAQDPVAAAFAAGLGALSDILPWIFPPIGSLPFSIPQVNVPVNINAGQTVTLLTYSVPQGRRGRIAAFGVAGSDFTVLQWSLLINGNPTPPITGLVVQFGTIPVPTPLPGPGIIVQPQSVIQLQVTNIGVGVVNNVQGRLDGYLWNAPEN